MEILAIERKNNRAKNVAEEGFPVVSCPSPEEIEKKLNKAKREYDDVVTADRGYDDAQAGMAEMRKEGEELILVLS